MSEKDKGKGTASRQPKDWNREDVISWLKTNGFSDDVRQRFIEHEITGEDLLDLNVDFLRSGMGIKTVHTQMKLLRAIDELRPKAPIVQPPPASLLERHRKRSASFPGDDGDRKRYQVRSTQESNIPILQFQPTLPEPPDENLIQLYRLFWGASHSPLFLTNHTKIPDARSLSVENVTESKFTTINLPPYFPDCASTLMVTKIFEEYWELLSRDAAAWKDAQVLNVPCADPSHATVISGQSGIGKTMFLSYVLVRRLQEKMVTIYCDSPDFAHVFSDNGVRRVILAEGRRIPELDKNLLCCALVNLSPALRRIPWQFFCPPRRLGRIVVATTPHPEHFMAFKERPALTYYMPTWNWDDLYCGSLVHVRKAPGDITVEAKHNESLWEAYLKFSGIPRICYKAFTESAMVEHVEKA